MPEYKFTVKDIIKGLLLLALAMLLFIYGFGFLIGESIYIFGETTRNANPLVAVLILTVIICGAGILGGFGKAMEAGFSPYRFFKKFRKPDKTQNEDNELK